MNSSMYTRPNKPRSMVVNNRKNVEPLKVEKIEVPTVDKSTECFTTPEAVIELMIDYVNFDNLPPYPGGPRPGIYTKTILEPSAGTGAIADYLTKNIDGVQVDCIELNHTLAEILTNKGHNFLDDDFLGWDLEESKKYDAVMMNPPFSNLQDIEHVMKAYKHLKPGGVLVAIMSPRPFFGSCKRATAFQDWFDSVGGHEEDLPEDSFKNSGTQVNSKLVVINN